MERVVRLALLGWLLAFVTSAPIKKDWDIYSFHINSTVTSRYATTVITSRVVNRVDAPKEIHFQVRIPKNAFISKFTMLIEGQMYGGVVKTKEQAQQQYTGAVSRGESAGVVSSVGRTLEEFKTSVTVAGRQKVTFELTYEELLKRTLGKYELQIHARPMQPVRDFKMDVYINEKPGITFVQVKGGLSTNALANVITKTHAHNQAWVHFYPTEQQQINCCGEQGMDGSLVVAYDVNRDASLGDIKVSGGYFVHHFAPGGLPRIPKNVVFIIDQSGSMYGQKMEQTRLALLHILGDLAEEDFFGLITFDDRVSPWRRELSQANSENLKAAKLFAGSIQSSGSTDINAAVLHGAEMLKQNSREGSASLLILLTDGDPTSGETNLERIQANVRKAITEKYPLYCLGFGKDVDFEFLEKMALENNGVARRIYTDSDADLQLQGFYEEVANPLLTDVIMIYIGGANLTKTNFSQYYNGSEIVVAGLITDNNIETFTPRVVAQSINTKLEYKSEKDSMLESTGTFSDYHLQRVWAYLTVKQLLDKELQLSGAEKENVKKEVLELSLKYSFVTPHTSMVVTKPPGEKTQVLHKPKEGPETDSRRLVPPPPPPPPGMGGYSYDDNPAYLSIPAKGSSGNYAISNYNTHDVSYLLVSAISPPTLYSDPTPVLATPPPNDNVYDDYFYDPAPTSDSPPVFSTAPPRFDSTPVFSTAPPRFDSTPVLTTAPLRFTDPGITLRGAEPLTTPVPLHHTFLLEAENQTIPLCYDVTAKHLRLLQDPSKGLSVNGKLRQSLQGGLQKIVFHYKTGLRIEANTNSITVRDGLHVEAFNWGQDHTTVTTTPTGTLILRDNEVDISVGDTRIVILLHQRKGGKLLWPVLRQTPSATDAAGILVAKPAVYSILEESSLSARLRIHNVEISALRTSAVDYRIASAPTLECWSVSPELALQRELSDFLVTSVDSIH